MALLRKQHYWELNAPIVSTMHGTWKGERSTISWRNVTPSLSSINDLAVLYLSPIFDVYEDYALRFSNAVLVESDSEIEAIAARGIKNEYGRIVKMPAGIDTETFRPENADPEVIRSVGANPDNPTVLFVGRLAARKGVFNLLDMFHRAKKESKDAQLIIVGTGPQAGGLRAKAAKLEIMDSTHFTGALPFSMLSTLYASSDLVVFPSFWEGQGLVPGEAMASGTPCLAASVGWVPELIRDYQNGLSYPPRDIETGTNHLITMLNDELLLRKMSIRARQDILDHWEWKYHIDKLEVLFNEIREDTRRTYQRKNPLISLFKRPLSTR